MPFRPARIQGQVPASLKEDLGHNFPEPREWPGCRKGSRAFALMRAAVPLLELTFRRARGGASTLGQRGGRGELPWLWLHFGL